MTNDELSLLAFLSLFLPHPDLVHAIARLSVGELPSPGRYPRRYLVDHLDELAGSPFVPSPRPPQVDIAATRAAARRLHDACACWTGSMVPGDVQAFAAELARALGLPPPPAAYTSPEEVART